MSLSKACEMCLVETASCRWGDVLPSGPAGPQFSVDQHLEICPSEALGFLYIGWGQEN